MVLKTLIEKQLSKHEKLYCCFVDFSKAFASVWRNGLLTKMKFYGISGKILSLLSDLYEGTVGHVIDKLRVAGVMNNKHRGIWLLLFCFAQRPSFPCDTQGNCGYYRLNRKDQ